MRALSAVFAMSLVLSIGCSPDETIESTPVAEHTMTAEELGRLGAEIHSSPERADQLLAEHGMTEEQLEQEIRRVAADPEESKAYTQAFEAAKSDASSTEG